MALEQASVLFSQGYITAPKGQDAVSKLREVLLLNPGNELAQTRLTQCAERLATVAAEAQAFGMAELAKAYIEEALLIRPDVNQWQTWRAQWSAAIPSRIAFKRGDSIFRPYCERKPDVH